MIVNGLHWILQPFFITNGEPIETWEFMSWIIEAMGCQRYFSPSFCIAVPWWQLVKLTHVWFLFHFRPRINLPSRILLYAALFSYMIHHRLGFQMMSTPLLHPDTVYFLSCSRTFNISKSRRLLGYQPIVSLEVRLFSYHPVFDTYFSLICLFLWHSRTDVTVNGF